MASTGGGDEPEPVEVIELPAHDPEYGVTVWSDEDPAGE